MKSATFMLEPWKWDCLVLVGGTPAEATAFAKRFFRRDDADCGEGACGHAWVFDGLPAVIWVDSLRNVPTLAHEALHVVSGVLEGRGISFSRASEEAFTYGLEDLLRRILRQRRWVRPRLAGGRGVRG